MALDYKSGLARYRRYLQVASERPLWRASAFVIFSLGLVIILMVAALRPTLITIAGLLGQIKSQEELANKLNEKIVTVQEASSVLNRNRLKLSLVDEALPSSAEWLGWAQFIEGAASGSAVGLQNVIVGPVQIAGTEPVRTAEAIKEEAAKAVRLSIPRGVVMIPFSVTAGGEYERLKEFIATLESNRRISILSQVQISKEKDGALTVIIDGVIGYSQKLAVTE